MKPKGLTLGVEFKRCDECERGRCDECAYKYEFEALMKLPSCHDCGKAKHCEHAPAWGERYRINCPLWVPEEAKR